VYGVKLTGEPLGLSSLDEYFLIVSGEDESEDAADTIACCPPCCSSSVLCLFALLSRNVSVFVFSGDRDRGRLPTPNNSVMATAAIIAMRSSGGLSIEEVMLLFSTTVVNPDMIAEGCELILLAIVISEEAMTAGILGSSTPLCGEGF